MKAFDTMLDDKIQIQFEQEKLHQYIKDNEKTDSHDLTPEEIAFVEGEG